MYITEFGIPKRIRTDAATTFRSEKFKQFCDNYYIQHIEFPIRDHLGNGKIGRLIRTLNERLRADKTIILNKGIAGLSRLLFALRMAATANGNSPFEQVFGKKPNTVKSILAEKPNKYLENDKQLQLSLDEFPKDDDYRIFLRDRTKITKLESQFKKKRETLAAESSHTITIETQRGRQTYSKRDVAKPTTRKGKSTSPKQKQPGDKDALERKFAALKEAEKAKPEENKPQKPSATKDPKQKEKPRSPRKQQKPTKSLTGLPIRQDNIEPENSSDEEPTPTQEQEETKIEVKTETESTTSRQSERT